MQAFELYFNPKKRRDSVFDSFVYEPEAPEEKHRGSLCLAGELSRAMPQNSALLDNVANIIKDEFYSKNDISEALRAANDFLDKEAKSGDVNWLGNLNFAIINIKDSVLNFTKVGNIKILLLRGGEILDISQNLELQDQEPYPLKVFSNIASGKLLPQDKILIITQDIFSAIANNEAIFSQLGWVSKEKDLRNIFKQIRQTIEEISGICLFIAGEDYIQFAIPKISKKIFLIASLLLIFAAAFFIFNDREIKQPNPAKEKIEQARSKIMMAENFIILKKEEKARALFQEARDILEIINTKESSALLESIEKYLR